MGAAPTARYDGLADWYEEYNAPAAEANRAAIVELLGVGEGPCLDLGCGGGLYFDAIRETGRSVVGLDYSADQLRIARARTDGLLLRADAAALPFADGAFPTVAALWISSDVDDFAAVLKEAARVLEPGGLLVYYGVHPCFNGPHVQAGEGESRIVHPVYREAGRHRDAPWWGQNIRRRVGMSHLPLADFLNAFLDAGLVIGRVGEPQNHPVPWILSVRAHRPAEGGRAAPPPAAPAAARQVLR
ncbi:class I SAM-dependent methyltransferase [Nonomuraea sp. H19]|uniref:class I SAM-dependent methyltransferase n=1 Tax=Nonomuraea sp. H19 TaxID=3452206 RepID=UPI003F8A72D5